MFGLMFERQTLISSSMHCRLPLFLHLIVARVEKPSSHKYDVENCNKTVSAFLDIATCSFLIEIQKASRDDSLYFIINPRSVDTAASSSYSVSVKLYSEVLSKKGFLIQSYCAVLSDGK